MFYSPRKVPLYPASPATWWGQNTWPESRLKFRVFTTEASPDASSIVKWETFKVSWQPGVSVGVFHSGSVLNTWFRLPTRCDLCPALRPSAAVTRSLNIGQVPWGEILPSVRVTCLNIHSLWDLSPSDLSIQHLPTVFLSISSILSSYLGGRDITLP